MRKACAICRVVTLAWAALASVGAAAASAGRSALAGNRFERGLERDQRVDVVLVGRQDVPVRAPRRDHGLHRLEHRRHVRIVHRRVLRCQREQLQQRRLVAGKLRSASAEASVRPA